MNTGLAWGIIGTVLTVGGTIIVAILTGRAAKKTADTNAAAGAWGQVLPIWQGTIEQLQQSDAHKASQIKDLQDHDAQKSLEIAELQQKDRINAAWKQAALTHLIALHTYIRVHLHRDDIPTVPPELAADIPPFTSPPPA